MNKKNQKPKKSAGNISTADASLIYVIIEVDGPVVCAYTDEAEAVFIAEYLAHTNDLSYLVKPIYHII